MNEETNGAEFLAKTLSDEELADLQNAADEVARVEEKAQLPMPLRVLRRICGLIVVVVASAVFARLVWHGAASLLNDYALNLIGSLSVGSMSLAVWAVLSLATRKRMEAARNGAEYHAALAVQENAARRATVSLGVPLDAPEADIFTFYYQTVNGEAVVKKLGSYLFFNVTERVFIEDNRLCLADSDSKYAFPLAALRRIRSVPARYTLPQRNGKKEVYYILELEQDHSPWGIYFSADALPVFETATGLHAE